MWSIKLINFLFLCRNLTTMYKKYKGEISPPPPRLLRYQHINTKQILTESKTKKQKTKPNQEKCELLQKCLKGVAFIRITPMAKNIKISTYKRDFVVILYFSQSTGEQFVSSYFIYNENNALVHSIDFERSIQNEKRGNVYIDRCCRKWWRTFMIY